MRLTYDASFRVVGKVVAVFDTHIGDKDTPVRDILIEAAAETSEFSNSVTVSLYDGDTTIGDKIHFGDYVVARGQICGLYSAENSMRATMLHATSIVKVSPLDEN